MGVGLGKEAGQKLLIIFSCGYLTIAADLEEGFSWKPSIEATWYPK